MRLAMLFCLLVSPAWAGRKQVNFTPELLDQIIVFGQTDIKQLHQILGKPNMKAPKFQRKTTAIWRHRQASVAGIPIEPAYQRQLIVFLDLAQRVIGYEYQSNFPDSPGTERKGPYFKGHWIMSEEETYDAVARLLFNEHVRDAYSRNLPPLSQTPEEREAKKSALNADEPKNSPQTTDPALMDGDLPQAETKTEGENREIPETAEENPQIAAAVDTPMADLSEGEPKQETAERPPVPKIPATTQIIETPAGFRYAQWHMSPLLVSNLEREDLDSKTKTSLYYHTVIEHIPFAFRYFFVDDQLAAGAYLAVDDPSDPHFLDRFHRIRSLYERKHGPPNLMVPPSENQYLDFHGSIGLEGSIPATQIWKLGEVNLVLGVVFMGPKAYIMAHHHRTDLHLLSQPFL